MRVAIILESYRMECLLIASAVLVTSYHTWRGYRLQKLRVAKKEGLIADCECLNFGLFYFADAFLYFVCTVTGFACLSALRFVIHQVTDWTTLGAGTGVLLATLAIFGLPDVTGQLPFVIQQGKQPGGGKKCVNIEDNK